MGAKTIETPIEGLKIKLNKVVEDRRGYLAEMVPGGVKNPFLKWGLRNIYLSVGGKKGVARGGHYHNELIENFFTVSGQALWYFEDMREDSKSFKETYSAIFGRGELSEEHKDMEVDSFLLPSIMAQVLVPTGVYHAYVPLADIKVRVVACGSHPYDADDYVHIAPEEIKEFRKILKDFS